MRAAVVKDFTQPLDITEVPTPEPGPGEVLVRVEASGLCHTDIHAARGEWPVKPTPPFIPGHEGVGIIEALGAGVTQRVVGQRVAVPWLGYACGTCDQCVAGRESLCERQVNTGYGRDGGFAEYLVANAALRPAGAGRRRPRRRRAAHLRRSHDVQGGQGLGPAARPNGRRSSASAAWGTSPCSTRASSAPTRSASTSRPRSCSSRRSSGRRPW